MNKTLTFRPYEVLPYVSWSYFFHAWGFPARFADIAQVHACAGCRASWEAKFAAEERTRATEAARLYDDALDMLRHYDEFFHTFARFALLRANGSDDDIIITTDSGKSIRLPLLRQQHPASSNKPNLCLSDFLKPSDKGYDTLGLFATTIDGRAEQLFADDPYKRMLAQTLCDRLSEATAERMHELIRKDFWGYAADEHFLPHELASEPFQGIRPAVGYPSLPDQSINFILEEILGMSDIGIKLTENGAMKPHASVSGLIFAHKASRYFSVGRIGRDQLSDYALRRGVTPETIEKYLSANI